MGKGLDIAYIIGSIICFLTVVGVIFFMYWSVFTHISYKYSVTLESGEELCCFISNNVGTDNLYCDNDIIISSANNFRRGSVCGKYSMLGEYEKLKLGEE